MEPETFLQACTIGLWQALHETLVSFLRFPKSLTPNTPTRTLPRKAAAHFDHTSAIFRSLTAATHLAYPPGGTIAIKFLNIHRLTVGKMMLRSNVLHCKIFKHQTTACRFFRSAERRLGKQ